MTADDDIFKGYGVEISLSHPEDFLKVKETLTRIGIASNKDHKLFQSCHILHKRGRYAIVHFKELFALDGKGTDFDEVDIGRRNKITSLLDEWGLVEILDEYHEEQNMTPIHQIKIIPYKEKDQWTLCAKYSIGNS